MVRLRPDWDATVSRGFSLFVMGLLISVVFNPSHGQTTQTQSERPKERRASYRYPLQLDLFLSGSRNRARGSNYLVPHDVPFGGNAQPPDIGVDPSAPRVITPDSSTTVSVGEPVTFMAGMNEESTLPMIYRWQFGDGDTKTGRTASHAYDQAGRYTVTFTASNVVGRATRSLAITVRPSAAEPVRITSITADPNPARSGQTVHFSSTVTGEGPLKYTWRFGGGSTTTENSPTHTYEERGRYSVRLLVSRGTRMDSSTTIVRVLQAPKREWTIVVASMKRKKGAQEMVRRYRDRLPPRAPSVQVLKTELKQGTRHRVVVGPFVDRGAAQQARKTYEEQLPPGAWLLSREKK